MKFDCSALNNVPLAYTLMSKMNVSRPTKVPQKAFISFTQATRMLGVKPKAMPRIEKEYHLKRIEFLGQRRSCVVMFLRKDIERVMRWQQVGLLEVKKEIR